MNSTNITDRDRDAILEHIRGLFDAFLAKDRDAIRRGHTADWVGFQFGSRTLVRGIDDYMRAAEDVLARLDAERYEFLDVEVKILDGPTPHALVWYLARDFMRDGSTVLLRSIDVYRREPGGWNQCGSHFAAFPEPRAGASG